jgi:hypothetical protein
MSLVQSFHFLVLSALVTSIYGPTSFGVFLFVTGLLYYIEYDSSRKALAGWTSILTKITSCLAYYSCRTFIKNTSSCLAPLMCPFRSRRPPFRPRPSKRHIHHYHLRMKVLNRRSPRPRRLRSHLMSIDPTFQATKVTRPNINIFAQVIRPIIKLRSIFQSHRLSSQNTSVSPDPNHQSLRLHNKHRSKYTKEEQRIPKKDNRKVEPAQKELKEDDPRGKLFSTLESSIDNICQHLDFIQLHRLLTLFCPLQQDKVAVVDKVNEDLDKFKTFLYTSETPHHGVGPCNVFISMDNRRTIPIVIDSGASKGLSPIRSDFIQFKPLKSTITGIGAKSEIRGVGIVRWKIIDQHGKVAVIETEAYYVPSAHIRLYSPQSHFARHKQGQMTLNWEETTLTLPNSSKKLSFPYDQYNALPLMILGPGDSHPSEALLIEEDISTDPSFQTESTDDKDNSDSFIPQNCSSEEINCAITDEQNVNLTGSQLELLGWHYKFGHVNMTSIQRLMHPSKVLDNQDSEVDLKHPKVLATKQPRTHSCDHPKCASCILGKMERMPKSTTHSKGSDDRHSLKGNDLLPGARVSLDQYVLSIKGRSLRNSSINSQKYNGGTIFVDHASGRIFNHHQVSLRAGETLVGKRIL